MKRIHRFFYALIFVSLIGLPTILSGQLTGTWQNQSGSYLVVSSVNSDGLINGQYWNYASGYNCIGTPYPVTGWQLPGTNTVTFTVKWDNNHENCYSLTAWTGFTTGSTTITTLWQLVPNGAQNTGQILQGSDTFRRVADKRLSKSLIK